MTTAKPGVNFRSGDKHCADLRKLFCTIGGWEIYRCVKVLVLGLMSHSEDKRSFLFLFFFFNKK